jgi:hypothetical protein
VNVLDFLSPSRCAAGTTASPLRRALDTVSDTVGRKERTSDTRDVRQRLVRDRSLEGKLELRGDLSLVRQRGDEQLVRLTPRRGFLLTPDDPADAVARIREQGVLAYDVTGGWAGMAIEGETLMRRLTDLDLDKLPAAGPFARVPAIVLGDGDEQFRVYVAQELAHDVALAVLDAVDGLANVGTPKTEVRLKPDPGESQIGTPKTEVRLKPDPGGSQIGTP